MSAITPPYNALGDAAYRRSDLATLASRALQARSLARSQAAFADSTAGEFSETWANLTNWSTNTGIQVSGGKLYSNSGTGSTGGINHSWALGATDRGRATFVVDYLSAASGDLIIGVSNDAAGAAPANGGASAKGLRFQAGAMQSWNLAVGTTITTPAGAPTSGKYLLTVTVDDTNISVVAALIGGTQTWRAQFARSGFSVNNLYILNTDTRNLTGSDVGAVVARKQISTATPSLHIEDLGATAHWSSISGNRFKIVLPASYDSRVPAPVAIMFHGNGSDENLFSDNGPSAPAYTAFLNAGYIVLSAAYTPATSTWGAQPSLDAYTDAYLYLTKTYATGPVVLYGESMGGIESLLALQQGRIPGVVAWIGRSPTFNLLNNYTSASGFTPTINAAYGLTAGTLSASASAGASSISSSVSFASGTVLELDATGTNPEQVTVTGAPIGAGPYSIPVTALAFAHSSGAAVSNFPSGTTGHDPALLAPSAFRGVPMYVMAASDDVSVSKSANGDALAAAVAGASAEVVNVAGITGGHQFTLTSYTAEMIKFANRYAGN